MKKLLVHPIRKDKSTKHDLFVVKEGKVFAFEAKSIPKVSAEMKLHLKETARQSNVKRRYPELIEA